LKVGDVYDTHVTLEQTETATIIVAQLVPQEKSRERKVDLQGRWKVLEVNADGRPTLLELTVKKFTDETGQSLIHANKVIEVKREAEQSDFSMKGGGEISEDAKAILRILNRPVREGDLNEDDVSGSKMPRKVGESWAIHSENGVKVASRDGLTIDPKDMTGHMTLKGVETINGGKALRIVGTVEMTHLKLPVPPGVTLESCDEKVQCSGLYPVDLSQPHAENETITDRRVVMSRNGAKTEVKAHGVLKETMTPVSPVKK